MERKKLLFFSSAVIIGMTFFLSSVITEAKSVSEEKTFLFVCPKNVTSTATIKLSYTEDYSTHAEQVWFDNRSRTVLFSTTWVTNKPRWSFGYCKHSTGKTFTNWQSQSVMYSSNWDQASSQKKTDKVIYFKNTSVTGMVNASVSCSGALVPTKAISVEMSLL